MKKGNLLCVMFEVFCVYRSQLPENYQIHSGPTFVFHLNMRYTFFPTVRQTNMHCVVVISIWFWKRQLHQWITQDDNRTQHSELERRVYWWAVWFRGSTLCRNSLLFLFYCLHIFHKLLTASYLFWYWASMLNVYNLLKVCSSFWI